jgi:hypothetical protein
VVIEMTKGDKMKRIISILLTTALVSTFTAALPAVADSSKCEFTGSRYYGWPGGGSIDSGISVGLSAHFQGFGSNLSDPACLSFTYQGLGVVKQNVAHLGSFSWLLHSPAIPENLSCEIVVTVNDYEWIRGMTTTFMGVDPTSYFESPQDFETQNRLKSLLKVGKNEFKTTSACESFNTQSNESVMTLDVHEGSFGEFDGVSVNDAADYTNSPYVNVNLSFTGLISEVAISNDAGFPKSQTKVFAYKNNTVSWVLRSNPGEKTPRKIYVKYRAFSELNNGAPGKWHLETFSDDIILDMAAPVISQASLSTSKAKANLSLDSKYKGERKTVQLSVTGKDDKSGVGQVQVSPVAGTTGAVTYKYKKLNTLSVAKAAKKVFVRLKDNAGNWAKWREVKLK